ncbi:hypothetical protein [Nocardioides sp. zg-DK7169]|uniref:hypothetical protein n=1 Tax=Nocardioides sp. zg-DK7169 TaxID=2736600 RepID=UPI00155548A4|nr:hypothetical protein [Nocardioides sp. zg-DK7169]NPC98475.1 hypothetical protein [Nocardioides sp. zg-DK7169]
MSPTGVQDAHPVTDAVPDASVAAVLTQRERLVRVVQSVGRRPRDITRRPWESAGIFAFFLLAYLVFGYWLVVEMHVVGFESLDRLNRALMIWHNDPAKLSAVGFDHPPLVTLLIAPATIIPALGSSLGVVPLISAVFAALTMVVLNTMLRRAAVALPLRLAVLAALGANPLLALYAAGGASQFVWISLTTVAIGALFAWYVTADVRFVMIAGLAFSVASLAGYTSLLWFVLGAVLVAGVLASAGADGTEVEGTTVGFAAPTVYVIALWTVLNLVLLGNPVAWLTSGRESTRPGTDLDAAQILQQTFELVLYGAPLALLVLPALLVVGAARGNGFALWLAAFLVVSIATPAVDVALGLTGQPILMRDALPVLVLSVVGAIWLARSAGTRTTLVGAVLVLALLVSIPWTFRAMKTYPHQNLESAFAAALSSRESQEGSRTVSGSTVGVASEQTMADYLSTHVAGRSSVLTDNAQTFPVMFFTGDPALFLDRIDEGEGPWQDAADDPAGAGVDFLLLSIDTEEDLLSRRFPEAVAGTDPLLPEIFRTTRYVLVGVPADYAPPAEDEQPADQTEPSTGLGTTSTDVGLTPTGGDLP